MLSSKWTRTRCWRIRLDAVEEGDLEGLWALVEAGASLEARYGEERATLAHYAAAYGDLEILQWIVERESSLLTATTKVRGSCKPTCVDVLAGG